MPNQEGTSGLQQISQTSFPSDSSPESFKNESFDGDAESTRTETNTARRTTPLGWPTAPLVAGVLGWGQHWEVIGNAFLVAGAFFFLGMTHFPV